MIVILSKLVYVTPSFSCCCNLLWLLKQHGMTWVRKGMFAVCQVCRDMVAMMLAFVQVGCLTLKVDLHSVNWLMSLRRWLAIREDTSSFRYVTMMLSTLSDFSHFEST